MKNIIFSVIVVLYSTLSFSQTMDKEIYPDEYSFEGASKLEESKEFKKAIWYYINLYPTNREKVINKVKKIATTLDTVDMASFIKMSFALYGTLDPQLLPWENNVPNMNMQELRKKGNWGDRLIFDVTEASIKITTANEYNLRSIKRFKLNDFEGALADLDTAISIEQNPQYFFNRGFTKTYLKDYDGAILDFTFSVNHKYRHHEAYYERGYCNDQIGKYEKAISDYSNAIEIKDDYVEAYNNRAFVYFNLKKYKMSLSDYDKAIELNNRFAASYVNRGYVKMALGDKTDACTDFKSALDLGLHQVQKLIDQNCN